MTLLARIGGSSAVFSYNRASPFGYNRAFEARCNVNLIFLFSFNRSDLTYVCCPAYGPS